MKKKIILLLMFMASFVHEINAQKYKFGKVSKEELEEKNHAIDSISEAAFLYKSKKISFEYNTQKGHFQKVQDVFIRIKFYKKEGFDFANQKILFYSAENEQPEEIINLKAVTYNLVNGGIEKQKVNKKEIYTEKKNKFYSYKKISFPNVKEGSVIELKYKLRSNFFRISPFWIQENIPVNKVMYTTRIPEYFNFKTSSKGFHIIQPKVEAKNNILIINDNKISYVEKKYTFDDENIPALKDDEPFTNNYENYRGVVNIELASYQYPGGFYKQVANTWKDVCLKLHKSHYFGKELDKTLYFKTDLERVLTTSGDKDIEKMQSVFDFVKSKITWNGYKGIYIDEGVAKAYKKGEGNISEVNLILVSMLKKAGLKVYPVLLSTKEHGIPFLPTLDGLNYVIAGVDIEGKGIVLLDASEKNIGINILPKRALNWEGRMLMSREVNVSVPLISQKKIEKFYIANLSFNEDFELSGKVMVKYSDREALMFRNEYNTLGDEKLKEKLEEKFKVNFNTVKVNNKESFNKPITMSLEISGSEDKYYETINDKIYINPLLFLNETKNPFKLETRKYPVDLVNSSKESKSISIEIPKGYRVASLPKSTKIQLTGEAGSYTLLVSQARNKISIKSIKEFNVSTITTSQYPELKDFYKGLVAKNKEKIVLEKIVETN